MPPFAFFAAADRPSGPVSGREKREIRGEAPGSSQSFAPLGQAQRGQERASLTKSTDRLLNGEGGWTASTKRFLGGFP